MAVNSNQYLQGINQTTGTGAPTHSGTAGDRYTDTSNGNTYQYTTSWQLVSYSTGATSINIDGNVLYVSSTGSDSDLTRANHIGDPTKPFLTLKAARDAAIAGDLIYVHPQTFTFDNRTSNGNFWNSKTDDINLWKNGINYYFSPGCKVIIYNQTVIGAEISLFKPRGLTFETCNVFGHLEYEQGGAGADTSNGYSYFFNGVTVGATDSGYTAYMQIKSIYSTSNNGLNIGRGTTTSGKATFTLYADTYNHIYTAGQSGSGCSIPITGDASNILEYNQNIRYIYSQIYGAIQFRGNLSFTSINMIGDTIISNNPSSGEVFQVRPSSVGATSVINNLGIIQVDIKKIYFTGPPQNIGAVVHNCNGNTYPFTFNLKGDCIEYLQNGNAKTLFFLTSNTGGTASRVLNYSGNIYTITASGETTQSLYSQGRRIAYSQGDNCVINIKGDINYNGPLVTLKETFKTAFNGVINYTGNIKGNFACPITKCNTGQINIYNSTIISNIDSSSTSIIGNGFNYINSSGGLTGNFAVGKINISNSYIKLKNSANYLGNGGYIDAVITNSIIINSGTTGSGIYNSPTYYADPMTNGTTSNTTPTGTIQLINSSIITDPLSISLYYAGTTAISSNSSTNSPYTITNGLIGSIDTITELTA